MSTELRKTIGNIESELTNTYTEGYRTDSGDDRDRVVDNIRSAISKSDYSPVSDLNVHIAAEQSGGKSFVSSIAPKRINEGIGAGRFNKFAVVLNIILFPPEEVCFMGVAHGHFGNQSENEIADYAEKLFGYTSQYFGNDDDYLDWSPLASQGSFSGTQVGDRLAQVGNSASGSNLSFESGGEAVRGNIVKATARRLSAIFAGRAYEVGTGAGVDNPIPTDEQILSTADAWFEALERAGFEEAEDIRSFLVEERTFDPGTVPKLDWDPSVFLDEDMPDNLVGLEDSWRQAKVALAEGKHLILYGPPGSGKTIMAEKLCETAGVDYLETVASSDWSNFDAVGGYTFKSDGSTRFQQGVFLKSISENSWLLVDEINRANIDRAVGALFGILASNHDEKRVVTLPFSESSQEDENGGENENITVGTSSEASYTVDPDWRIVATMNTLDKASLFQLSYAFMRRFAFVEVPSLEGDKLKDLLAKRLELDDFPNVIDDTSVSEALVEISDRLADEEIDVALSTAILLDAARFYGRTVNSDTVSPVDALLEALSAVAFPQFEGFRDNHADICSVIAGVLDLNDDKKKEVSRSLATWTGQKLS